MKKQIKEIFHKEEELEAKILELENIISSTASSDEKMESAKALIDELRKEIVNTHYEALTDDLTGFLKKKVIKAVFQKKVAEAKRNQEYISMILLDIDHMKLYNDTCGHLKGTKLIKNYAKAIQKSIRGQDIASRYGGDEFLIIGVHKHKDAQVKIIDRMKSNIETLSEGKSSASFGASVRDYKNLTAKSFDEMFEEADEDLYREKKAKKIDEKRKMK